MLFLIDGYNFLFRINGQKEATLEKRRQAFISSLDQQLICFKPHVSLIFDSRDQTEDYAQCAHFNHLDVFYAPRGKSADEYILELVEISKNPRSLTIVTSDKSLALLCQQLGAKTLSIEAFIVLLSKQRKKSYLAKQCYQESLSEMERLLKIFSARFYRDMDS